MIKFKELFDTESRKVRFYTSCGWRLIPLDLQNYVKRMHAIIISPSGFTCQRTFDIWEENGVEFVIFFHDTGSVEFYADQEVLQPF